MPVIERNKIKDQRKLVSTTNRKSPHIYWISNVYIVLKETFSSKINAQTRNQYQNNNHITRSKPKYSNNNISSIIRVYNYDLSMYFLKVKVRDFLGNKLLELLVRK